MKTAYTNSPWAYIREGLLPEGYLRLRFWGEGAYFREGFFLGGGGAGLLSEFHGNARLLKAHLVVK